MIVEVLSADLTTSNTEGVYLHGKLWYAPWADNCKLNPVPTERGIYDCKIYTSAGSPTKGVILTGALYFWFDSVGRNHGLVVASDDLKAIEDAKFHYGRNSEWL